MTVYLKKVTLLIYIFIQLTWGILQTLLGFILFIIHYEEPHDMYHGSVRTKWLRADGISLGLFIFTPTDNKRHLSYQRHSDLPELIDRCERISVHEYGHTIQSLILGPLYLIIIGLVSFTWSRLDRYKTLRKLYGVPYSFCWTEQWANYLGEKILKSPSLKR